MPQPKEAKSDRAYLRLTWSTVPVMSALDPVGMLDELPLLRGF